MEPVIAVVALGEKTAAAMESQLRSFLKKNVTVNTYCLENMRDNLPKIDADLAIISSNAVLPLAAPYLNISTRPIVVRRSLSVEALDKLLALPGGTKVLACHKYPAGAKELVASVKELGISNIECLSTYEDAYELCSSVKTALVAGDSGEIPAWVNKTIDIGPREIELASLVEIAHSISYPLKDMSLLSLRYTKEIARRSELLSQALRNNELLRHQIRVVLDTVQDALIGIDCDGLIRVCNSPVNLIADNIDLVGRPILDVIPDLKAIFKQDRYAVEDKGLIHIKNKPYHVTVSPVKDNGGAASGAVLALRDASDVIRMENEIRAALKSRGHMARYSFDDILGISPAVQNTIHIARKLAASDLNVLIYGENGTGKELFAQSMHRVSAGANGPFVAANCAALPASLLESELFGYEEGAFTGAKKGGKPGLIEQAHGGTIFLDEIGDISCEAQARLLRVIQEKEVMRIGCTKIIPVDVRIIAATNKDLKELVTDGLFREDLYYRLCVAPLYIPPLRDRKQDISYLTQRFLQENNLPDYVLDAELLDMLTAYSWPGNVRELQSLIRYAAVVAYEPKDVKAIVMERIGSSAIPAVRVPVSLSKQDMPLYQAILEIFHEAKRLGFALGRGGLSSHLRSRGFSIGEQAVRNRLKMMNQAGLLTTGKGRQASCITPAGEKLLLVLRKETG